MIETEDQVNMSSTDFISRSEYETRHSELRTEMIRLGSVDDNLRRDMTDKLDAFSNKMDLQNNNLMKQIGDLNDKLDKSQTSGWKLVALSLINLIVGVSVGYIAHYIPPVR